MSQFEKAPVKPYNGNYLGFDHITFNVGNAYQAATFYVARFGFELIGYKGLETKSRDQAVYAVKQDKIVFVFICSLENSAQKNINLNKELEIHGDAVKDIAFHVDDCRTMYNDAVKNGGVSVHAPFELTDEEGTVVLATIQTYGDVTHTFVERKNYKGQFMPGFQKPTPDPLSKITPPINLNFIDHIVGNQPDQMMMPVVKWYEDVLKFNRFWSVDDKTIHTEYSSLRSTVMSDYDEKVKMPINEPAEGKRKSQIQEFVDYYHGGGVQHIALNTTDIINAITHLRARGVSFLKVPTTYYTNLRERLAKSPVQIKEDLDTLQKLDILVDFDDKGYLLQLFTKPLEDRPLLFIEIIQRANHQGFGAGNFKSLFEAIERDQELRGNL